MKTLWPFLKSPTGNVTVFMVLVAVGGLMIYRGNARERARAEQMTTVAGEENPAQRHTFARDGQPLKIPAPLPRAGERQAADVRSGESRPHAARQSNDGKKEKEARPVVLPISVYSGSGDATPTLSKNYAPFGRMIPCETVITLESSKLDTPVVGLVTEDVWHDGRLVIPAGTEVHGRASLDRSRERIAASGRWVVVWRDGSPFNGTELVLNGIALDRQKDDVTGEFGMRDGSAGLVGQLIKSDNWQEIKLFASTFLAGMASGLQEMRNQGTAFGDTVQVPVASGRNAALQGTSDVLNLYAQRIQEVIARDGFYVRVPAGKQFYLYVTETIDQATGTRGNQRIAEIWRNENANK
ncbi:MAG: TrbI/VirB10 family protein [Opitutaceae bacterium]|nr:TrbI/VirB10 family protein [Opitutaceae bacterium]MDX2186386.1 TrbI/VirB10 family protein [Opitutaceae bacterium]